MRKYKWLLVLILISATVTVIGCTRDYSPLEQVLPDTEPEMTETTEMVETETETEPEMTETTEMVETDTDTDTDTGTV